MSTVDRVFLAVCVLSLTLMLTFSKVIRAIVWESLRHPFTRSRIELHDGSMKIWRGPLTGNDEKGDTSTPSPASQDKTLQGRKELPRG